MTTQDKGPHQRRSGIPLGMLVPACADRVRPSPNSDRRPHSVTQIECVVLHATADGGDEAAAEAWLCNRESQVSAHLHVRRDGSVVRLVADDQRAWHAGHSAWEELSDLNDFSLGWELANRNDGREPFTTAQCAALSHVAAHYVLQGLPVSAIVSHADVALPKGRKTDPAGFDWVWFRNEILRRTSALTNDRRREKCWIV